MFVGIDTGGTFTDFVAWDSSFAGGLRVHKVLSTPKAPERAILQGLRDMGLIDHPNLEIVHGTTVATNAVLEGKGVRTAYVTNRGFADVLTIGRQARTELYNLQPHLEAPPVPPELCIEVAVRRDAHGEVIEALTEAEIARVVEDIAALKVEAVAINFLFSYLKGEDERCLRDALGVRLPDVWVSISSEVLPEYREYERGMATWLNAWIGPRVAGYLQRLQDALPRASLRVLQSSGQAVDVAQAARNAVRLLLSGPAGGLAGARATGEACAESRLLSFDMGGTSTDVALIDGAPQLTDEGRIAQYPVAVPMVAMHTIGAGGGSIAFVDAAGGLQVGPQSAGAWPGPAGYDQGGDEATVSDANIVLGRLLPDQFLGGRMPLNRTAAEQAVGRIAVALKVSLQEAAQGILAVANMHMVQALRVMSVQRGIDPRALTLLSFGGAGGLHVCALAEALEMRRALVPAHAGVLSALGMRAVARGRERVQTWIQVMTDALEWVPMLEQQAGTMQDAAIQELLDEGLEREQLVIELRLDLRYVGQAYTLEVAWQGVAETRAAFHAAHQQRYGHDLDHAIEIVNVRVRVQHIPAPIAWLPLPVMQTAPAPIRHVSMSDQAGPVAVFAREDLAAGMRIAGPALITETVSTTWLAPGWQAEVQFQGSLLLRRGENPVACDDSIS
jgi:N-methylhydantoinase A